MNQNELFNSGIERVEYPDAQMSPPRWAYEPISDEDNRQVTTGKAAYCWKCAELFPTFAKRALRQTMSSRRTLRFGGARKDATIC
ncbi:MAG: hypothetical protein MSG64_19860 [Pyrinomonadaceae bacterium MAG19_C2-C3]|nr:hypothetical protein [Pyrinomonadaceae bacterium MAG19_C2-C3]